MYKVEKLSNLKWRVSNVDLGISVTFKEGLFEKTQTIEIDNTYSGIDNNTAAAAVREMNSWIVSNCEIIIECDVYSRLSIINKFPISPLISLLVQCSSHINHEKVDINNLRQLLNSSVDYAINNLRLGDKENLPNDTQTAFIKKVESLTDREILELYRMTYCYNGIYSWSGALCSDNGGCSENASWPHDILWWNIYEPCIARRRQSPKDFGELIRTARKSKGMSLYAIELRSGVDSSLISKMENGIANPTLENILKVTNAMDVDLGVK